MAIIKCPECGHQISDKAPVCPQCGVEIAGKITRCPQCGEVYFKDQSACPVCRHLTMSDEQMSTTRPQSPIQRQQTSPTPPIPPVAPQHSEAKTAPQTQTEQPTPSSPKKNNRTVLIISFIVAAIICAGLWYFYAEAGKKKELEAYEYAIKNSDPAVLQSYLDTYPDAPQAHRDSIRAHLSTLQQIDQQWNDALVNNSKEGFEEYLENHPNSPHKAEARHKIDSLDWVSALAADSEGAYKRYLEDHPNGEYVDEANDGLKRISAQTVQPQERQMISSVFRNFFQSVSARDEEGLRSSVSSLLTSFLGKPDATKSDVVTFMNKIYKEDTKSMNWKLNNDYKIDKKEVGDEEYEYTVNFSTIQEVEKTDGTTANNKFKVKARINPDGEISEMNMTKIVE
ncbi:zinc-ribbon domain-containing protein [Prevotella sp. A2931]|uniref:Zinc-ribbon domain-containing protein n=1 Tax=Prevotella illustrans TaxID=2800387 RepID=A0ABS3M4Z3_9BACT|nr:MULTISPECIES: zinc ribbon domain-containing protein [Prevotella]MBO1363186.1 zinc-ribbon domain-containing protein [Prevotella illustrans]PTL25344.1 hypothetical protein C3V39_11820 [Prevotella sp. oral taxon 820]